MKDCFARRERVVVRARNPVQVASMRGSEVKLGMIGIATQAQMVVVKSVTVLAAIGKAMRVSGILCLLSFVRNSRTRAEGSAL